MSDSKKERIQLSDHFTFGKLLAFTIPSMVMMVFTSIYSIVDGFFVSNFAGKTPFAAINLIMPIFMIIGSFGFMIGTGGTAVVAITLGQGRKEDANRYFSMLVYCVAIFGALFSTLGQFILPSTARLLGAEGLMLDYCILYGRILLCSLPFYMLQNVFQAFFVTAEKPRLGLFTTVIAGCMNIVLDALLVGVFRFGLTGAAVATAMAEVTGGLFPIIYFSRKNDSLLRLGKTSFMPDILGRACINGMAEFMNNVAMSVVNILYNLQLIRLAGEDGVAAYGVVMYVSFIFIAVFIGYSMGSAPLAGFNYGADNTEELRNLFRKSMLILAAGGIIMVIVSEAMAAPFSYIYTGYDDALYAMTLRAFRIFSLGYALAGFNIYTPAFLAALGKGPQSALLSFLRALVLQGLFVLILPEFFGLDGVWFASVCTEIVAVILAALFLYRNNKTIHYAW